MAFYPQFPAMYAYPLPMHPGQQDYYMYPPTGMPMVPAAMPMGTTSLPMGATMLYPAMPPEQTQLSHPPPFIRRRSSTGSGRMSFSKPKPFDRKDSNDSGISVVSYSSRNSRASRKSSSASTVSNSSMADNDQSMNDVLEDIVEEEPFEEPDDDVCDKVVAQVEFYFSDANVTRDKFLLKHVRRNKEGFVSLKLVSSFKRVKPLVKDWRQVAYAIELKSKKLALNEDRTKVRRLDALPEYDEMAPTRTVIAFKLPFKQPTVEAVAELFSPFGDIALVRILRPGNALPADIKPFASKHPSISTEVCALVEFERTEYAVKAVKELSDEKPDSEKDENKMKVAELVTPAASRKNSEVQPKPKRSFCAPFEAAAVHVPRPPRRYSHVGVVLPGQQPDDQQLLVLVPRRKISVLDGMKLAVPEMEDLVGGLNEAAGTSPPSSSTLNPNAPVFQMASSPPTSSQSPRRPSRSSQSSGNGLGLHVRRISEASGGLVVPINVIRMPKGPDASRGFHRWTRSNITPVPVVSVAPSTSRASNVTHHHNNNYHDNINVDGDIVNERVYSFLDAIKAEKSR